MHELARVRRGTVIESRHFGVASVITAEGAEIGGLGGDRAQILPRSTVKPFQALGIVTAGLDISGAQLAVVVGSHTGEDRHVEMVRSILAAVDLEETALQCPKDWPEHEETRHRMIRSGEGPQRIRMNCSGKHAGMLAACAVNGWSTDDYLSPDHPLQRHIRATMEELTGEGIAVITVDGCGAPLFQLSVFGVARGFRELARARGGSLEHAVASAMREYPFYVGGSPHQNSDAMIAVPGLLAKGGAEGVIGMAAATGQAVALKVVDGSPRATTLIALSLLDAVGVDVRAAEQLTRIPVLGGGMPVGSIEVGSAVEAFRRDRRQQGETH